MQLAHFWAYCFAFKHTNIVKLDWNSNAIAALISKVVAS